MARAIEQKLSTRFNVNTQKIETSQRSLQFMKVAFSKFIPRHLLKILREEIRARSTDAVFDCSGFHYSDLWKEHSSQDKYRLYLYQRLKKLGGKIILLPQTFGAFKSEYLQQFMASIIDCCDLVYARDYTSYQSLLKCSPHATNLKISPDFTLLLPGEIPANPAEWHNKVCIVPNIRMIDKTPHDIGSHYLTFLQNCIYKIINRGLEPFIMLHAEEDHSFTSVLAQSLNFKIQIIDETAIRAKGIIGCSYGLIGSRYHALISGLNQAIPTIGTRWIHKYNPLFEDYDCSDCLIDSIHSESELDEKLSYITDETKRTSLITKLKERAAIQKAKVLAMWDEVELVLNRL